MYNPAQTAQAQVQTAWLAETLGTLHICEVILDKRPKFPDVAGTRVFYLMTEKKGDLLF